MIKVTQEMTQLKGSKLDLAVEFTALIHHFIQDHIFTVDEITHFVELGSMSEEELKTENERLDDEVKAQLEAIKTAVEDLPESAQDLFTDLFGFLS